jgi:hypothetical protein
MREPLFSSWSAAKATRWEKLQLFFVRRYTVVEDGRNYFYKKLRGRVFYLGAK